MTKSPPMMVGPAGSGHTAALPNPGCPRSKGKEHAASCPLSDLSGVEETFVCRVAAAEFDPLLSSATLAGRWVAERLERRELPQLLVEAATLSTSELVANAIVHTPTASGYRRNGRPRPRGRRQRP
jgi:hypothetical protein